MGTDQDAAIDLLQVLDHAKTAAGKKRFCVDRLQVSAEVLGFCREELSHINLISHVVPKTVANVSKQLLRQGLAGC